MCANIQLLISVQTRAVPVQREPGGSLLFALAMKQLLLFAVFPPSCVRSPEPRYQIVAAGRKKKKKKTHTQLFMLTQHFIGRICQDQFIRHPVNFFTLIWPPNFLPSAHNFSSSLFPFLELLTSNWELGGGGGRSSKIVQIWLIWRFPSAWETHGMWRFGHFHFWLILSGSPPCSGRPLCERYVSLRLQRLHFMCVSRHSFFDEAGCMLSCLLAWCFLPSVEPMAGCADRKTCCGETLTTLTTWWPPPHPRPQLPTTLKRPLSLSYRSPSPPYLPRWKPWRGGTLPRLARPLLCATPRRHFH